MGQTQSIDTTLIDMKLKSRELMRMSNRALKEEKAEKFKVKDAIRKNNKEGARQLSSRLDAVASRLDAAYRSQQMTAEIQKAVPSLASVMKSLDIGTLYSGLNKFQRLFEDLDVRSEYVSSAIESTTATSTPIDLVDQLITQVAEEHALDLNNILDTTPKADLTRNLKQSITDDGSNSIAERLKNL